jgi:hypothetical protein
MAACTALPQRPRSTEMLWETTMFRRERPLWTFEPRRRELAEQIGPLILKGLSLLLAAVIAVPLLLNLFAALLV